MKAIIIAAGEGSRMGKLTQNIPKPLVMVNGKSIIERQLSILKQNGILDIIIITGPHHKKFNFVDPDRTKAFTNERNDEEKIEVFDTSALKGTGLKTKTLEDGKKNVFLHLIDKIHKFHLEKSGVLEYAKSGNAIDLSGQKSQNGPCGGSKC